MKNINKWICIGTLFLSQTSFAELKAHLLFVRYPIVVTKDISTSTFFISDINDQTGQSSGILFYVTQTSFQVQDGRVIALETVQTATLLEAIAAHKAADTQAVHKFYNQFYPSLLREMEEEKKSR